ncbi:DUF4105 domain-containing protein [Halopseudomonas sp.]|uniref:DUF7844 domain-containing protein n=1 Tax=Halopseudomonas sp. TaxID=2901191 RepID=UPI0031202C4C
MVLTGLPCRFVVLLALVWSVQICAALRLEPELAGLTAQQQRFTHDLLRQIDERLPPLLKQQLDQTVSVRWADDLNPRVVGRATFDHEILLNARLLDDEDDVLAQRTLVHELAHLYDRLGPVGLDWRCAARMQTQGPIGLPPHCRGQTERRFRLRDDPRLLDLAGWPERVGSRGGRERENRQLLRSPDAYELSSPAEFTAVNAEYFLLDPSYACRRPALYRFFVEHFGWAPFDTRCADAYPYLNAGADKQQSLLGWLDPERVYAVHYLLAEPEQTLASRWGHSMLRLVICAPGRPRGPDCLLDLEQDLVFSFRAYVDDVQLSHWDGLVGEYPSRLFMLPLAQVVDEYTKLELRSLRSVPLQLSRAEIEGVVLQAAQLHWGYDGRYFFIGNNCAVETLKLLRTGSRSARLVDLESQTPIGLLQLLEARGLANSSVLVDATEALRLGYRFDSYAERYRSIFASLRERLGLQVSDFEQWLALSPDARARWFAQADLRSTAALLLLEQAALRRQLLEAQHTLKVRYLRGTDREESVRAAGELVGTLLRERGFLSRPADLLGAGYGLPQPAEWQALSQLSEQRKDVLLGLEDKLEAVLPTLLSVEQQQRLAAGQDNLERLQEQVRRLKSVER